MQRRFISIIVLAVTLLLALAGFLVLLVQRLVDLGHVLEVGRREHAVDDLCVVDHARDVVVVGIGEG